ncbi:hypothetical protein U9M48_042388, partial [Paspalum notatum var. saurae]
GQASIQSQSPSVFPTLAPFPSRSPDEPPPPPPESAAGKRDSGLWPLDPDRKRRVSSPPPRACAPAGLERISAANERKTGSSKRKSAIFRAEREGDHGAPSSQRQTRSAYGHGQQAHLAYDEDSSSSVSSVQWPPQGTVNPYGTSPPEGGFLWPLPGKANPVLSWAITTLPYMEYSGMLPHGYPHSPYRSLCMCICHCNHTKLRMCNWHSNHLVSRIRTRDHQERDTRRSEECRFGDHLTSGTIFSSLRGDSMRRFFQELL